MRELIRAIGIKHFVIYHTLAILEIIINTPFYIIKAILFPAWYIYNKWFDKTVMFGLLKIKRLRVYSEKLIKKYKDYTKVPIGEIAEENIRLPKEIKADNRKAFEKKEEVYEKIK